MTSHETNQELFLHAISTLRDLQEKMNEMVVTFKKLHLSPSAITQATLRNDIKETQIEIDELKEDLNDPILHPMIDQPKLIDLKDAMREELLRKKRFLTSLEYDFKNSTLPKASQKKYDESLKLDIESALLIIKDEIECTQFTTDKSITDKLLNFQSKLQHRLSYPQTKSLIKTGENLDNLDLRDLSKRFLDDLAEEFSKIGIDMPFLKEKLIRKSLRESDKLEMEERNLLWVAYPELKQIAHTSLIRIQELENFLPKIERSVPRDSKSRILDSLLKEIHKKIHSNHVLSEALGEALRASQAKAHEKGHTVDFTVENYISRLKQALAAKNNELHDFYAKVEEWLNE